MSSYLFLFLIFLPLPMSVAFFVFSSKSPRQGYLLGLIPIFLFWQIVCLLLLRAVEKPCQELCGFFETALGSFTLVLIFFSSVLGLYLRRFYRRVVGKTNIPRRSLRSMAAAELPFFLAILLLSILCGLGFYGFTRWSVESGAPFLTPLFYLGYGNYLLLKQGIPTFIVANVLILALFWILYTRLRKKL
jgi:hypothetical protein